MSSLFTKIINKEIPCYKVYEDEFVLAFLDIFPIAYGHTLVIPKKEVDSWLDLSGEQYLYLQIMSQKIAKAVKQVVGCQKIGQMIDGRDIPHCHIHLIPLVNDHKINEKSAPAMAQKDFEELSKEVSQLVDSLGF
jgi:histidine triad (HIT) family protein